MKKYFASLLSIGMLLTPVAQALTTTEELQLQIQALLQQVQALSAQVNVQNETATTSMPPFTRNLRRDSTDATSGGEVSRLQQFLAKDSSIYPEGLVTGYFGAKTELALQRWQKQQVIVSSGTPTTTGYGALGPRTRAAINATLVTSTAPRITSLSHPAGEVGADIEIRGSGFTNSNLVNFGSGLTSYFSSSDGKTLAFRIPSAINPACSNLHPPCMVPSSPVLPGNYEISLTNEKGTSNKVSFSVVQRAAISNSGDIRVAKPPSGTRTATNVISVTNSIGTSNQVTFEQTGLPAGVTAAPLNPCAPPCNIVNTLTITTAAVPGTYPITITARSSGIVTTTNFNVIVAAASAFEFHAANTGDVTIAKGYASTVAGTNTIGALLDFGTAQQVKFIQTGLPTGVTVSSGSCSPPCSILNTISVKPTVAAGTYPITVVASSGNITSTSAYNLIVLPYTLFTFDMVTSGDITINRPTGNTFATGSNTITTTYKTGTAEPMSFYATGFPTGAGSTIAKCTPSCTTTNMVTINSSTPVGSHPITITGYNNGTATSTTSFILNVR